MKSAKAASVLDRLAAPLGECLTPESARRLLALKAVRACKPSAGREVFAKAY